MATQSQSTQVPRAHASTGSRDAAVLIGPLDTCWVVTKPLALSIEVGEDGNFVVSDNVFFVYGDGDSLSEAWSEYRRSLIEYCEMTHDDAHRDDASRAQYLYLCTYMYMYIRPHEHE